MPVSLKDFIVLPFIRQADFASRLPWSYGERRLLDYLLVYIEEGHCRFTINGISYDLRAGDFILVQPGDLVLLEGLTETRTPFAHLDFFYNPAREQSFPTSPGMTNLEHFSHLLQPRLNDVEGVDIPPVFQPNQPFLFKNKLLRMIGLWKEGTTLGRIECQQLGTDLLLELVQKYGGQLEKKEPVSAMLERVTAFLSLHLNESVTVEQMAAQVHLSPSRFTTIFREKYGLSPYQYLLRLRIERAMDMMKTQKELTITQIAEYCGFHNIQHFSMAFQQMTGVPPSQFRKRSV